MFIFPDQGYKIFGGIEVQFFFVHATPDKDHHGYFVMQRHRIQRSLHCSIVATAIFSHCFFYCLGRQGDADEQPYTGKKSLFHIVVERLEITLIKIMNEAEKEVLIYAIVPGMGLLFSYFPL